MGRCGIKSLKGVCRGKMEVVMPSLEDFAERLGAMAERELGNIVSQADLFSPSVGMQPEWRAKIGDWLVEMAHAVDIPYHTVAVALAYLDQVAVHSTGIRWDLQLLSLTCLFIASKFFQSKPLSAVEVALLSNGKYSTAHITETEKIVLECLQWKLNVVTPHEVMATLLTFEDNRDLLMAQAELFLVFTMTDLAFIGAPPSTLGAASILCAFEQTNLPFAGWLARLESAGIVPVTDESRKLALMMLACVESLTEKRCGSPTGVGETVCYA